MPLLPMALIYPSKTGRPLDNANVDSLVASITEVGRLIHPLFVKPSKHWRDLGMADCYDIISGHHRYAAACKLGWKEIECTISTMDDLHNELAEIDENLMRAAYTPAQQAAAIARRKTLYEELYPETKHGANRPIDARWGDKSGTPCHSYPSFVKATARKAGVSERYIRLAAQRGRELGPEVAELAGTSLDKAKELDALRRLSKPEQAEFIRRAKAGENVSAVLAVDGERDIDKETRQFAAKYTLQELKVIYILLEKLIDKMERAA